MKKQPIILIGGGGHCISCIDVLEQTGLYEIVGILDLPEKKGSIILGYPVIGTDDDIPSLIPQCRNFLITVGQIKTSEVRRRIFDRVKYEGGNLPVIISSTAQVSQHAAIEEGTIIMNQAFVNAEAAIGRGCIINTKALIEHETIIGDFCHISTGACVNGQVKIGSNCFIGSNSIIVNNLAISDNSIIGSGSQVMKGILNPGTYIGNPLRKI